MEAHCYWKWHPRYGGDDDDRGWDNGCDGVHSVVKDLLPDPSNECDICNEAKQLREYHSKKIEIIKTNCLF